MSMFKNIIIAVIVAALFGFLYYTISPIFNTITVNDDMPRLNALSSSTTEAMNMKAYPVIGTVGHPAEGIVRLIDSSEGKVIRYENYKTLNGPDLFVYLSKDLDAEDFVSLGEIRGTEGNINYLIPEGIDLAEYRYVLTWCKQFGVLFNYVDMSTSRTAPNQESVGDSTQGREDMNTSAITPTTQVQKNKTVLEKTALLGNGCFWCVEHDLEDVTGVINVVSGYAGGSTEVPTYKNYADGGHREVVLVTYDADTVTYANLVEHIIKHGDPSDGAGSFGDRGEEYAPAIYYENEYEKGEAVRVIDAVNNLKVFEKPLPLVIIPRAEFWSAEEYHQDYAKKNPLRYSFYRKASGRDSFIEKHWGDSADTFIVSHIENMDTQDGNTVSREGSWESFLKPSEEKLRAFLTSIQYEVTQEEGTERPFKNSYDKNYEEGIYVDVVSGEPLFLSKDKFDSGTGWPSFVKPISPEVVMLKEDNGLFTKRTEVRSRYADSHLGHVFDDGPADRGGKRFCMNSASLRFIPRSDMEKEGYAYLFPLMNS